MMYETNNWAGGNVAKYRPDFKFGVAPPPVNKAGDKPLTWSGGFAYVMSAGVKDADTGWELMKWLIGDEGWTVAYEGNLARSKALGGVYLPGMTGQPDLDKRMFAKYKSGLPAVDKVPDVAVPLMQTSRVREPSLAAQNLWDGVKAAQTEAISQAKTARQALDDNNTLVQKALDDAWANVPK
jgi:ABC-type glycerol-3-phosphate transport system substrate-binding protein